MESMVNQIWALTNFMRISPIAGFLTVSKMLRSRWKDFEKAASSIFEKKGIHFDDNQG
jgi:hypothetical protein